MTIARWGLPTLFWTLLVATTGILLLPPGPVRWTGIAVAVAILVFELNFFRNPRRIPPEGCRNLVSGADGVVADITEVDEPDFIRGRAVRIGVFMNVFNVHVNRSPVDGTVEWVHYRPGKYLDVRHPDCSHQNEANRLGILADPAVARDLRLVLVQLSGLIARRIVCTVGPRDRVNRGGIFGMIRFGSRVELFIPTGRAEVKVQVGQKVRCGETVLAAVLDAKGAGT